MFDSGPEILYSNPTMNIKVTLGTLLKSYLSKGNRAECPIELSSGETITHIYRGYGAICLESNPNGVPKKKGFGNVIFKGNWDTKLSIKD